MEKNEKLSSIELIRIIAMLMIIIGHLIGHTHFIDNIPNRTINYFLISMLQVICYPATNIYVLISGYLLCEKTYKTKRVATIWLHVFLYSMIGFGLGAVILKQFSFSSLLKALLPISGDQYWFARVYFGLYLLMPFLNLLVDKMNKRKHELCLMICTIIFSLWRSFIPFAATLNPEGGNSIIWFIVLYLFGAYVRRYGKECKKPRTHPVLYALLFIAFAYCTRIFIELLSNKIGLGGKGTSLFTEFTSFPMLFSAMCILLWEDKKKHIKKAEKAISWVASSTFSVYLIHENVYIKRIFYPKIDIPVIANTPYAALLIIMAAIIIFTVCVFIDKISVSIVLDKVNRTRMLEPLQRQIDIILQE